MFFLFGVRGPSWSGNSPSVRPEAIYPWSLVAGGHLAGDSVCFRRIICASSSRASGTLSCAFAAEICGYQTELRQLCQSCPWLGLLCLRRTRQLPAARRLCTSEEERSDLFHEWRLMHEPFFFCKWTIGGRLLEYSRIRNARPTGKTQKHTSTFSDSGVNRWWSAPEQQQQQHHIRKVYSTSRLGRSRSVSVRHPPGLPVFASLTQT